VRRVPLARDPVSEPSHKVILSNGGVPDGQGTRRGPILDQARGSPSTLKNAPNAARTVDGDGLSQSRASGLPQLAGAATRLALGRLPG
jgi:hypothetical protein